MTLYLLEELLSKVQNKKIQNDLLTPLKKLLEITPTEEIRAILDFILILCSHGKVPDIDYERDLSKEDFAEYIHDVIIILESLLYLLKYLQQQNETSADSGSEHFNEAIVQLLIICACHSEDYDWSCKKANDLALDIIDCIVRFYDDQPLVNILAGNITTEIKLASGLAKPYLLSVLPHLSPKNWRNNPSTKYAFTWCLFQIKHPYLGDLLSEVLPPSLLLVDDFLVQNKVLGIKCISHIIDNNNPTELRWHGRAEVIYSAIERLLYSHEVELISVLHPSLLQILNIVENDPVKSMKYNRYDKVLQKILLDMALEQRLIARRVYPQCLPRFIEIMGVSVVKHMQQLLEVIYSYLETYDGPEEQSRILTLQALKSLILTAWPRIPHHAENIFKSLVKLLYDIETDTTSTSASVKNTLKNLAVECLVLTKMTCPKKFQALLDPFLMEEIAMPAIEVLKLVQSTNECPCTFN